MSEPLDKDLKKMKKRVAVPPDFLARVREQIAREQVAPVAETAPERAPWWRGWADFFSQNTFPVAAAAVLVIFSGAVLVWEFIPVDPTLNIQITQKGAPASVESAAIASRDVPSETDAVRPGEVIVRIELLAEDQPMVTAAPAPLARARKEAWDGSSADTLAVAEASPGIAPGGCVVKPGEGKPGRAPGGCVVEKIPLPIPAPVIQSSHGADETIRIVEQIARDYSVALIDDKLKRARQDSGQLSSPASVTVEIPAGRTNDFMMALKNAMSGSGALTGADTASQPSDISGENADKVQITVEITMPPQPMGVPPK